VITGPAAPITEQVYDTGRACRAHPALHRLWELTSTELARWRSQLQCAISDTGDADPLRAQFCQALDDVQAEEESRARIAAACRKA
jgi:hypothetical protein